MLALPQFFDLFISPLLSVEVSAEFHLRLA